MKINTFLQNLGIASHPGLRINRKLTGYRDFAFGCRGGFGRANIRNLCHELGHAVQFGPRSFRRRAEEYGFSFRMRHVFIAGQYCDDPKTAQASLRELDTFACQAHLMDLGGVVYDREKFWDYAASVVTGFMPDWFFVPGEGDEGRKKWCIEKLKVIYARRRPETVLRRLKQWLDATEQHLVEHPELRKKRPQIRRARPARRVKRPPAAIGTIGN